MELLLAIGKYRTVLCIIFLRYILTHAWISYPLIACTSYFACYGMDSDS